MHCLVNCVFSSLRVVETLGEKELDSSSYALPEGRTYVPNTLLFLQQEWKILGVHEPMG